MYAANSQLNKLINVSYPQFHVKLLFLFLNIAYNKVFFKKLMRRNYTHKD